jgi:hypothetical protein
MVQDPSSSCCMRCTVCTCRHQPNNSHQRSYNVASSHAANHAAPDSQPAAMPQSIMEHAWTLYISTCCAAHHDRCQMSRNTLLIHCTLSSHTSWGACTHSHLQHTQTAKHTRFKAPTAAYTPRSQSRSNSHCPTVLALLKAPRTPPVAKRLPACLHLHAHRHATVRQATQGVAAAVRAAHPMPEVPCRCSSSSQQGSVALLTG